MYERLTKFNPETNEYEYKEPAITQEEFNAQRKAVIQRLGELEDKTSDVAEEIFAEIENAHEECIYIDPSTNIGYLLQSKFEHKLAELKKKYTKEITEEE